MHKARDIIARSIETDLAAFRAALIDQAEQHDNAMMLARVARAAQGARAQKMACLRAYDFAGRDDLPAMERAACIAAECGPMVIALNVAAKLQGLSRAERTAAAVDWQEAA